VEARNASDIKTNNYTNTTYSVGTVSLQAENNNSGTDLSARLAAPGGSWSSGAYAVTTSTATFSRPSSPDGPFELLAIGVSVSDADGAVLANRDMNPTNTSCTAPTCTATAIG